MGFFRRFFFKGGQNVDSKEDSEKEDNMLPVLEKQYKRDIEEDVSTIASILENEEEAAVTQIPIPAPDYDEHDASVDDILSDSEMESYTEKNVIEHNSVDELGNHLESASIIILHRSHDSSSWKLFAPSGEEPRPVAGMDGPGSSGWPKDKKILDVESRLATSTWGKSTRGSPIQPRL